LLVYVESFKFADKQQTKANGGEMDDLTVVLLLLLQSKYCVHKI
jgi:hypothetical protein